MRSLTFEPHSLVRNASCSPLLQLPLEIRNKIWASLLGDRLIHFEYVNMDSAGARPDECLRSWHSTVCQYDRPENEVEQDDIAWKQSHSRCAIHVARRHGSKPHIGYGCGLKRELPPYEEMHLTALRVCRQNYNEADRVLWSTNTFSFDDEVTFRRFMDMSVGRITMKRTVYFGRRIRFLLTTRSLSVVSWTHGRPVKCDY